MDQTVTPKGERCSTAKAYLRPALETNKNLTVRPNSMVNRLVFDENDKTKCIGAEFTDTATGVKEIVYCNKEVICCLGSIGSPQLLQVSGIGDGEHLSGLGIEVRVDNDQIGANLQDHLEFYVQYVWERASEASRRVEASARASGREEACERERASGSERAKRG